MNYIKKIWLVLILIGISAEVVGAEEIAIKQSITSNTTILSIPSPDADDATLLQYALQLRETQPELFAGAQGVLVLEIVPNSQAEKKGLQRGDIVVAYVGEQMNSVEQLISTVQSNADQPQIELRFIRAGTVQMVMLQKGEIGISVGEINELDLLQKLGEKAYHTFQYPTAFKIWQIALKKAYGVDDKHYISLFLGNLGIVWNKLGLPQKALEYYQQALAINYETDDKRGQGINLTNIGLVFEGIGQYPKALEYYQKALKIHREIINKYGIGNNLNAIGKTHENLGQPQKALEYYQQALAVNREIGRKRGIGNNLNNIGVVYLHWGQYQTALGYYRQALATYEVGNKRGRGNSLTNIGVVYEKLGEYQKALQSFQQALVFHSESYDKYGESADFTNIGIVYYNQGQYQQALKYYQQALAIDREIYDKRGEGTDLSNIGVVYQNLGQYQQALKHYRQALALHRSIEDKRGESAALTNIGLIYTDLGKPQKTLKYYQQALKIKREIDDKRGIGKILTNIGLMYKILGEYQALEYFQQALTLFREIDDKRGEGKVLSNIGVVYSKFNQYQKALKYFQQGLVLSSEIHNKRGEGDTLLNIGVIYGLLKQYKISKTNLQDSLTILKTLDVDSLWNVQGSLGYLETLFNRPIFAITHFEQALDNIERLRAGITEKEHELSFMRDKLDMYDRLIILLQNLHQDKPTKGYDRKALEIFERKQARIFLEEMGRSGARQFAGLAQQKSQQEFNFENQLTKIKQYLVKERYKPVAGLKGEVVQNQERINNLEQREQKLQTELEVLQEDIKTNHPDYYALKYPEPVQLDTLQEKVLQPDELMLVYGVMEESTTLWVIGKDTFQLFDLPLTEEMLTEKVNLIRRGIENQLDTRPKLRPKKHGLRRIFKNALDQKTLSELTYELYTLLVPESVRPLLKKAKKGTLYIVPTGPLYALPFEMLVTQPVEQSTDTLHYLVEEAPIAYLSSASLLKILRDAKERRKKVAPYPLLAFANPVYDEMPTFTDKNTNRNLIAALRSESYHALRGVGFTPLPETEDEAKAIATFLKAPKDSEPLQVREAASCDTVNLWNKETRLDDYQHVVFATHGILPDEVDYISQPALILSHPDTEKTKDIEEIEGCSRGYLKMKDVFALQLNAKLVTLSACNTGRGKQERGEGVMGLTRAFMYAGTPAVAVTLWSIESHSAKTLNIGFFQHLKYLKKPAAALRAMKLRMLQGKEGNKYKHPYYWAPFVVFGEEPVEQQPQEQNELAYYQQAKTMYHEIGDKQREAKSLTQIGEVYFDNGQYQQTLEYFQDALAIHRELNDKYRIMDNLFQMGDVYFELGQYKKGREYYQRAAKILR